MKRYFSQSPHLINCTVGATGVTSVDANLETQKVTVVVAEGGPEPEEMLAALKKWGDNANKTVALAEA